MNEAFEKILDRLEELQNYACFPTEWVDEEQSKIHSYYANKLTEILKLTEQYNNGWIACSDRLPEKNGMYLCTQNSYDLATNKNIIRVSTELVEFYNGKWRRAKNLVITHWHPLPEPYKERD